MYRPWKRWSRKTLILNWSGLSLITFTLYGEEVTMIYLPDIFQCGHRRVPQSQHEPRLLSGDYAHNNQPCRTCVWPILHELVKILHASGFMNKNKVSQGHSIRGMASMTESWDKNELWLLFINRLCNRKKEQIKYSDVDFANQCRHM